MDILKTPHQKLLEEAGAIPASPGMVNTPEQMLMQQSGIMPQFADGGNVSGLPKVSFETRSIPNMTGTPGIGYEQGVQGAIARMQLEQELKNRARLRAGVSGLGMAIPGQHGVKMMPGQMDVGVNIPIGPGNLDISANRSINPVPGRGYAQGANAKYSVSFADGGSVDNEMTPEEMIAELIAANQTPQMFKDGGRSIAKKLIMPGVLAGLLTPDIVEASQQAKEGKYGEAAGTAGLIASGFLSGPLQAILMGMYPSELGKGTLDEYYAERVPGSVLPARLKPENMK